ncbi:HAMP domain-containing sensor histidine kinase [[Clostridium] fimetarium]|uniref:histidine kinase n=1 Tax=[Clostridium] fimetarium TaxID=99656 RepID=A0A1I0NZ46_9FIRM|nr:HAMP domain-containing sensor histidine kinase [[Clostridium] fimetarium]SEW06854.1 Signal transduction histidine kinase [[Clostridium] fimetarium]
MKINKIIIGVTLILIIIYAFTFGYINKTNIETVDVTKVNNVVKSIEKEFDKQQYSISKTGEIDNLSYKVVYVDDENYNSVIFDAMKSRSTVADLTSNINNENETKLIGKVIFLIDDNQENRMKKDVIKLVTVAFLATLIIFYVIVGIIYVQILKPFAKMKRFAAKIAEGDLEFQLLMDKNNYFGAFTESFDMMREELMKAKQSEYKANISKKELVAELSHDIMTPVATIKAICELLQVKLRSEEDIKFGTSLDRNALGETAEKIEVIYNKADVIDKLISDMFHTTLEELEMLKVNITEQPSTIITQMFMGINNFEKIHFQNSVTECLIKCDPLRLGQVIDNIISNSYKYAGTEIDVRFDMNEPEKILGIKVRDYGGGVDDNELPLVCEKFYRGSQETEKKSSGSGLGLYLARQFMEGMGGTFDCYNEDGFVVEIHIKIV